MGPPTTPEDSLGLLENLNDDVLLNVCSFLDPIDCLQLGKTCRHAYIITVPARFCAIDLRGFRCAAKFYESLLVRGDPDDCCKYIRSLTFTPRFEDKGLSSSDKRIYPSLAADIITHAHGLRSLTLMSNHVLYDTSQHTVFFDAVARLANLMSLSLNFFVGCDPFAYDLRLAQMASRPRHISIPRLYLGLFRDPHVRPFFSCAETLELESLWGYDEPLPDCEFVSVRTLIAPDLPPEVLAKLSRLFPRVTHLLCQYPYIRSDAGWPLDDPQFVRWNSLDTLWYNAPPPVAIPTRAMHITKPRQFNPHSCTNYDYLRTLELCTPTVLVIFMQYKLLKQLVRLPMLKLRYLSLCQDSEVVCLDKRSDFNVASRLVQYAFALHKLRFPLVGVCFHYNSHWSRPDRTEQFSEDALRAPATKLAACVPTLEYVGIKAGGRPEDREPSPDIVVWFRVVRSEQSTWVEKMWGPDGGAAERRLLGLDIQ